MSKEVLKMALEALKNAEYGDYDKKELNKAITALREELAREAPTAWVTAGPNTVPLVTQPAQQEPVAVWELFEDGWDSIADPAWMETLPVGTKLYTSPSPQRNPLSDEEALEIARTFGAQPWPPGSCVAFARAIEAAHGIKENT